MNPFTNNINN